MVNIEQSKCTGCGQCVNDCVQDSLRLQNGKAERVGPCILCGHCVAICPAGAAAIPEYEMQDVEAYDKNRFAFDIGKLLYTIKFRRSIRDYAAKPVEREKLENIVQAGRYTATGVNYQACRFIVAQDGLSTLKEMIWGGVEAATEHSGELPAQVLASLKKFAGMRAQGIDFLFRNAPAVLYIAAESKTDAGLAAQNMELAAISQGLGVLYNGYLAMATAMNPAAREWLGIQDKPISACMLAGYPQKSYKRTAPRRAADVRWR